MNQDQFSSRPATEVARGVLRDSAVSERVREVVANRRAVLAAIEEAFRAADFGALNRKSSVWAAAEAFLPGCATLEPRTGFLEIAWPLPSMRMSVAMRCAEVRIGFIFAAPGGADAVRAAVEARPEKEGCEVVVRPSGPSRGRVLVDHIYRGQRFATDDLLEAACAGDTEAAAWLADSIFLQAHHLRASVVSLWQSLREQDAQADRPASAAANDAPASFSSFEIESVLPPEDLAARAGVASQYVLRLDEDGASGLPRYLVSVPSHHLRDVFLALADESDEIFVRA